MHQAAIRLRDSWDGNPVYRKSPRVSQMEMETVRAHLQEMLQNGVLEHSSYPWGCPVFCVQKPSSPGQFRVIADLRGLSRLLVRDRYALPDMDEVLSSIQGAKVISCVDAHSGFYSVPIVKEHRERTALATPWAATNSKCCLREWPTLTVPSNAPSTCMYFVIPRQDPPCVTA